MAGEQQHYVPRFLLENFTAGKKPQIWVYDKKTDNVFQTNVKNVAAEKGFYDLEVGNSAISIEPSLSHLETKTSNIVETLIKEKNLKKLDTDSRIILSIFLAVQFIRTKEHRLRFEQLEKLLIQTLRERGVREEDLRELIQGSESAKGSKIVSIKQLLDAGHFVPYFINKGWVLFETTHKIPFYISDNPVTLHNQNDYGPYGNLGLAVKGIEIYFPVSTTLCLGLYCQTITEEFLKGYETLQLFDQKEPGLADKIMKHPKKTRSFCDGIVNGTPISVVEENVTMLNSLQVMYSSRFVYCESNSFGLVKRMIGDNQKYREGLRPTIN